ncbi:ABC transporter permease [Streptosporangium sp. NPDC051022]|uniref:ABC transporter permease n=1 Tax=Streptosporangium sp. NPDC051022 TaxID=3155752 RepID=UPI00341DE3EF
MAKLIGFRLLSMVPLLLVISVLVFLLAHLIPGSVAVVLLGSGASPEAIKELEHRFGLDQPLPVQYGTWIGNALRGDLGLSTRSQESVLSELGNRIPATVSLLAGALLIAALAGIAAGIAASLRPGGPLDRLTTVGASAALALPSFWVGILLSVYVGVRLGWLPAGGYVPISEDPGGWAMSLVLPWIALGLPSAAVIARQTRSSMIVVMRSDFIRAAVACGVPPRTVILRHAVRNALVPVIPVIGFQLVVILGASFVVESSFVIDGIGSMAIQAIFDRDIPLIQGTVLAVAVLVLVANLLADVALGWVNPKVRS